MNFTVTGLPYPLIRVEVTAAAMLFDGVYYVEVETKIGSLSTRVRYAMPSHEAATAAVPGLLASEARLVQKTFEYTANAIGDQLGEPT